MILNLPCRALVVYNNIAHMWTSTTVAILQQHLVHTHTWPHVMGHYVYIYMQKFGLVVSFI